MPIRNASTGTTSRWWTIPGTSTDFPTVRIWDTPWAVILPGVFSAFNFLLFKGFFDTIPDSVIQAARVDGGSEFNIFRRIVLPMSVPVFAVAVWGMFAATWDHQSQICFVD